LKTRNLMALLASVVIILILITISCAPTAAPTTPTPTSTTTKAPVAPTPTTTIVEVDRKYNVVDPTGIFRPVQTQAISPRLDTIDGKTIYVCQGEADPVIMPALYKRLVKDYPKTKFIYYDRSDFGPTTPGTGGTASSTNQVEDPDILKKVQGIIRGIGW
jgi:hypothetical protein